MKHLTRSRILVALALGIGAYVFLSGGDDEVSPASSSKGAAHSARQVGEHHAHSERSLAVPTLAMLEHRVDAGTAPQALFASHTWYKPPPPPPPAPIVTQAQSQVVHTPTAPPLPFEFMGRYAPVGQPEVFFLTRSDRVYDVHVGDVIDSMYSVDSFNGKQLVLTYKPLNIQQQLNAEGPQ